MKKIKWILSIFNVLVFSMLIIFNTHAAQQMPTKLIYTTLFPETDKQGQLCETWAKEIEKRSHGQLKIVLYSGSKFLHGDQIYEGLVLGTTDIGMSAFAYSPGLSPVMQTIDYSIGYPSARVATAVINGFYKNFQPNELTQVKILYLHAHGPGLLHSKKPVNRLEDLKGMRIRSAGFSAQMTEALGAVPIVVPQEYTKVSLEDHYVDATWSPMEVLKGWGQASAIKYTIEPYCTGYTSGFYAAMNLEKWKVLPKAVQGVFEEVSAGWISKHAEAWDSSDKEGRLFTLKFGKKIMPLSKEESDRWCRAVQPVIDEYVRQLESKGLPGKEYMETIRKLIKKYE